MYIFPSFREVCSESYRLHLHLDLALASGEELSEHQERHRTGAGWASEGSCCVLRMALLFKSNGHTCMRHGHYRKLQTVPGS